MKAPLQEKSAAARNAEANRGGKSMPAVPIQKISEKEDLVGDNQYSKETTNENRTGLPDNLKSGIETLSRLSMDDVKVHYNSPKPAQLQALAYAQGSDIHVAAGQERHLPHEAWHVVQQKQGRVKPTMQMKADIPINDDAGLESEADLMGSKALLIGSGSPLEGAPAHKVSLQGGATQLISDSQQPIQRQLSMTEMMKIGSMSDTYKFVVGTDLYGKITAALNTAQEVHDLFTRIKETHPVLFSDAAAKKSGIPLGSKLAKKLPAAKAALPALVTSLLPGTAASSPAIPVASSSNSSSSTSSASSSTAPGPVTPTMIISAPKTASALTFGEPSASSSALSAESTNPSVTTAEIRSGGINNHGTYSGEKGKLTKATIAAYVVANHQSAERQKAPGGGDQFVLRLGYVGPVQWFITYHLGSGASASKAIITHFGPFGEATSSKYE